MPVDPKEQIRVLHNNGQWLVMASEDINGWNVPRIFQRHANVKDYDLGRPERFVPGETELGLAEPIRMGSTGGPAVLLYMAGISNNPYNAIAEFEFRRVLKAAP